MPADRKAGVCCKIVQELLWDRKALERGFKVVRLHYKDEQCSTDYVEVAMADVAINNDLQPLYTPSYEPYL